MILKIKSFCFLVPYVCSTSLNTFESIIRFEWKSSDDAFNCSAGWLAGLFQINQVKKKFHHSTGWQCVDDKRRGGEKTDVYTVHLLMLLKRMIRFKSLMVQLLNNVTSFKVTGGFEKGNVLRLQSNWRCITGEQIFLVSPAVFEDVDRENIPIGSLTFKVWTMRSYCWCVKDHLRLKAYGDDNWFFRW